MICPNKLGIGVGSILTEIGAEGSDFVTYRVVGVLANPTYRPVDDYIGDSCESYFESYDMNDYTIDDPQLFIYISIVVAVCCMITLYNTSLRISIGMIF